MPKEASVFDAVYWGQAIGEVLYERLNSLAADALAEFGKSEAEFRKNLRYVQKARVLLPLAHHDDDLHHCWIWTSG